MIIWKEDDNCFLIRYSGSNSGVWMGEWGNGGIEVWG